MASPQSASTTLTEDDQMMPERSEDVILCWRCICMKRCQRHNTSNLHRNKCLVTTIVLGIIFLSALVFSVYCMTFDEDDGQMICIPTSYSVIDLKQYPPEKTVTLENVYLNCWKERETSKIAASLQNGTRWLLRDRKQLGTIHGTKTSKTTQYCTKTNTTRNTDPDEPTKSKRPSSRNNNTE